MLVEYGPGVGTFTREILRRMSADAVLIAIELNTGFVEYLRDPRFRVVQGRPRELCSVLAEQILVCAGYIISSLPYLNMTDSLRREIFEESRLAERAEGSMLLFPYTRTILPYLESMKPQIHGAITDVAVFRSVDQVFRCEFISTHSRDHIRSTTTAYAAKMKTTNHADW